MLAEKGCAFVTLDRQNGVIITEPRKGEESNFEEVMSILGGIPDLKWNISIRQEGNGTLVTARLFSVPGEGYPPSEVLHGSITNRYGEFFEMLDKKLKK